jgi:hypothetical protein
VSEAVKLNGPTWENIATSASTVFWTIMLDDAWSKMSAFKVSQAAEGNACLEFAPVAICYRSLKVVRKKA